MKKNNTLNKSESGPNNNLDDNVIYIGDATSNKDDALHEEDDTLSENRTEDQEEQNEIHNNFFDNQPKENKRDIKGTKA